MQCHTPDLHALLSCIGLQSQVEYFLNLKTHYVQGCDRQVRAHGATHMAHGKAERWPKAKTWFCWLGDLKRSAHMRTGLKNVNYTYLLYLYHCRGHRVDF